MTFVIPSRYCGPPQSGNGGWVSGHAAALLTPHPGQGVSVRLSTPPPLDRELTVTTVDDVLRVHDGQHPVLEARLVADEAPRGIPAAVSFAEARAAGESYEGLAHHPFPTCFSCGTARERGDGLRLQPGRVPGGDGEYACAWLPTDAVDVETVWAALDCPGGWASGIAGRPMVLGTMTAWVHELPTAGTPHVVMAWQRGAEGRKHHSGTALYAADGHLLAQAQATWIAIDPSTVRPVGDHA